MNYTRRMRKKEVRTDFVLYILVNDFKKARTHRNSYYIFHRSKFVATAI